MSIHDDTVERLQTKIAFLEQANTGLSDVVFRQQQEIRALGRRIDEIAERLETSRIEDPARSAEDERPPHY
jgi:uncharacterized coiled-coil protein SlyX